jgi:hypothetical protein
MRKAIFITGKSYTQYRATQAARVPGKEPEGPLFFLPMGKLNNPADSGPGPVKVVLDVRTRVNPLTPEPAE